MNQPFDLIHPSVSGDKVGARATGARRVASDMTVIHNGLIRGINAIYLQCKNVAQGANSQDKLDFASFASVWGRWIAEHHHAEETLIFPEINELTGEPGLMNANVQQHALFHDGLVVFQEYVDRVRDAKEDLDGDKLRGLIDNFMPALRHHLEQEISSLLRLEHYADKCDWEKWFNEKAQKLGSDGMKSAEYRNEIFPLTFCLHDRNFGDGVWADFPPIPWIFKLILRMLFLNTHSSWWRFAPCDMHSSPKGLPFWKEDDE